MVIWHGDVASSVFLMAVDFCHENNFVPVNFVDREAVQVMDNGHIKGSFGRVMERVVDLIAKNLMVQRVVQGREKLSTVNDESPVEDLKKLSLEVCRSDALEGSVKHFQKNVVITLIERVHPLETHPAGNFELIVAVGSG